MKLAKRVAAFALCASAINAAHAVSGITITGELVSKKAEVTLPELTGVIANVQNLNFKFEQGANAGCRITTSETEAKAYAQTESDMLCLLEWTSLPAGLSAYSGGVNGFLTNYGDNLVGYTVSIFSGTAREKVTVETGEMTINAAQAISPNITEILTSLTNEAQSGNTVTSHSKSNIIKSIKTTVEPRPFAQVVKYDGLGNCTVPVNGVNCTINAPATDIVTDEGSTTGGNSYPIKIDSQNGYFTSVNTAFNDSYNMDWDFRTPELNFFALQAVSVGSEQSITTDLEGGVTLSISNETAKLVLKSPHEGEEGTWWHPTAMLTLKADETYQIESPSYTLGGEDILQNTDVITLPTGEIQVSPNSVTQEQGYWVFEFNISEVPDGIYIPNATVRDTFNNGWTANVGESQEIDRNPPTIRLYSSSGNLMSASDSVLFFDDLLVAAVDSLSGAAKVVSATVDGIDILGDGVTEGVEYLKHLKTPSEPLIPNTDKVVTVVVEDHAGNRSITEMPIRYMPIEWQIDDRGYSFTRNVQSVSLNLNNVEGPGCRMYSSASAARSASASINYRCYVEWLQYPDGITSVWSNNQVKFEGVFEHKTDTTNSNTARYNVWMINRKGSEAIAYQGEQVFNVTDPSQPTVSYAKYREFADSTFITTVNGGVITTATTEFVNGDINFIISDGIETKTYPFSQSGAPTAIKRLSKTVAVDPTPLWTETNIDIKSQYIGDSTVAASKQIKIWTVPATNIIGSLTAGPAVQDTTRKVQASVNIGVMNYAERKVEYNAETMGTWKAKLAIQTRNRDGSFTYNYLTDELPISNNGAVSTEIDFSDFDIGSSSLVALITVDSQIEGYEKTIKSNAVYFQVYKGLAIDGSVDARRISGKAPFNVQMLFAPESLDDRRAKGSVDWEMSTDGGSTWEIIETDRDFLRKLLTEKGIYRFRAKVTNKFSGVVSLTDEQEILVYDTPSLKIDGVRALHPGEGATYTLYDNDEDIDLTTTEVEWSLDGVNWVASGRTFDLTMDDSRYNLQARAAYIGTDLAGNARYSRASIPIRTARLQPVRVGLPYMRAMEEGVTYDIDPKITLADTAASTPLHALWTFPDGSTTETPNISYTPTAQDTQNKTISLKIEAWAEGYKSETLTSKTLTLYAWDYSFPSFEITSKTSSNYAPTTGTLLIGTPTDLPPYYSGITFDVNWELPEGIEVIRENDRQVVFNVDAAGIYPMKAYITDSRGETRVLEAYITANAAPEPEMHIDNRYSNSMMREPLMLITSLTGKLGHPLDRVASVAWYLDDELVEPRNNRATITGIPAGVHQLRAVMTSKFNIVREYHMEIPVAKNVVPVCDVKETNYTNIVRLDLVCSDEDGKMSKYEWNINGEVSPYIGSYMYVSKTAGYSAVIIARGVDDSGDYSNSIQKSYSF